MYLIVYKNSVKDNEGYEMPIYMPRDVIIAAHDVYKDRAEWPVLVRSDELDSEWDGFWDHVLEMYPKLQSNVARQGEV